MKRKAIVIFMATMMVGMMTACGGTTNTKEDRNADEVQTQVQNEASMVHLESAEEVAAFFDEVYANIPAEQLPSSLMTTELDLQDMEMVSYHTGLTEVNGIEGIALSESMMGSIAYSAIYIRTQEGADVEQIRQNIMDNIDPAKWICVTAEKQIASLVGDDIFFVMAAADTADLVYGEAVKVAERHNMQMTEPLEKTNPV